MDFIFDKHSQLPATAQIQEQIKLALLLGRLRPGDTLPSIRDVEKQVGISRNLVRKAYLELQSSGILDLRHGKGVLVEKDLQYNENVDVNRKCEAVSREVIAKLRHMGVSPTSFARYLYQHAREDETKQPFIVFVDATHKLAQERSTKISSVWQTVVPGMSIDELKAVETPTMKKIRKILTNYLRYDQVVEVVDNRGPEVIPIGLAFEPVTVREWSAFPSSSSLVYVMDDRDYPSLSLILDLYRKILLDPSISISPMPRSRIPDLKRFVSSKQFHKTIFSNRIWEELPDEIRRHPKVTYPHMAIDLGSLENARIRAGIII